MSRKSGRVTATQVARHSGVSQATVSYVLNNTTSQKISEKTRARVLRAVEELGYTPFEPARALASGQSSIVLFVAPEIPTGFVIDELFHLLSGLLAERGRTLLNHRASSAVSLSDVVAAVSPAAVISMVPLSAEESAAFRARGIRVEIIGFQDPGDAVDAEVVQPQRHIGRLQVEHLVDRGHIRLGYALPEGSSFDLFARPREEAVRESCRAMNLADPMSLVVPLDAARAADAVGRWKEAGVTAVCAFNDEVAIAVLGGAREKNVRVPEDLAVVGVDDIPLAALVTPPLTSVRLAVDRMARELAAPLITDSTLAENRRQEVDATVIVIRSTT